MDHLDENKFSLDQVMMSLSAVAYSPFHSISMLQDNLNGAEALEQAWSAIWWEKDNSTIVFMVKNKLTEEYAIVFRGPVFKFGLSFLINQYEDLSLTRQESMPHSRLGNARVAAGILDAIQSIGHSTYGGRTLQQVVNNLPARTKLYIAGHSLGGALAAAYAAKMVSIHPVGLDIIPYIFGAPALGNESFAALFDPDSVNYLFTRSHRCVNIHDIMPFAWGRLRDIATVDYGDIRPPVDFTLCLEYMERLLILSRIFYAQPPTDLQLKDGHGQHDTFYREAMHQHQPNTYMHLLGLDPINNADFYHNEKREFMLTDSL